MASTKSLFTMPAQPVAAVPAQEVKENQFLSELMIIIISSFQVPSS